MWTAIDNIRVETLKQLPFIGSLYGGGRLPSANALPSAIGVLDTLKKTAWVQKTKQKALWVIHLNGTLTPFFPLLVTK